MRNSKEWAKFTSRDKISNDIVKKLSSMKVPSRESEKLYKTAKEYGLKNTEILECLEWINRE